MAAPEPNAGNFETSLDELEKVVKELESGDLPLDRSLDLFSRGMKLSETCRKQLEEAETRVEQLIRKEGGWQPEPFRPEKKRAPSKRNVMTLKEFFSEQQQLIDAALDRFTPPESQHPATIHRAMRHSLFAGGKRIRPILCIAAASAVSDDSTAVMNAACSLEMIHTYSLIHDDLPALDNDDFRRGKPTCHKVFGEAMAILAGDALFTLAIQTLTCIEGSDPARVVALIRELSF